MAEELWGACAHLSVEKLDNEIPAESREGPFLVHPAPEASTK